MQTETGMTEQKILDALAGTKLTSRDISTNTGISQLALRTYLASLQKRKRIASYVKGLEVYYFLVKAEKKENDKNLLVSSAEVADLPDDLKSQLSKKAQQEVPPPNPEKKLRRKYKKGWFTPREKEIYSCLDVPLTNSQIAKATGISFSSVCWHLNQLKIKGAIDSMVSGKPGSAEKVYYRNEHEKKSTPEVKPAIQPAGNGSGYVEGPEDIKEDTQPPDPPAAELYPQETVEIRLVFKDAEFEAKGPAPLVDEWMTVFMYAIRQSHGLSD